MHGLEAEYYDRVGFVYLDIDDPATEDLKRELGYRVQPHIFLLDANGNIVAQYVGAVGEEQLRTDIDALLEQ